MIGDPCTEITVSELIYNLENSGINYYMPSADIFGIDNPPALCKSLEREI